MAEVDHASRVPLTDSPQDLITRGVSVSTLREVIEQQRAEIAYLREEALEQEQARENLEAALVNARKIGAAIGIVMRDQQIGYERAYALLSRASQKVNRKLRDLADDVLLEGHLYIR